MAGGWVHMEVGAELSPDLKVDTPQCFQVVVYNVNIEKDLGHVLQVDLNGAIFERPSDFC